MRLYNYLNEETAINKIKRLSEPFFKEFGDAYENDNVIWRGHKDNIDTFKQKKRRENRKPRIVSIELHEYLGKISEELFGWNVRSTGVFCGDHNLSTEWGNPYIFIPLGNYRYVWTKNYFGVYGLYDSFSIYKNDEDKIEDIKGQIYQIYKKRYKDEGLSKVVDQGKKFEAIFDCDFYTLINPDYWDTFKKQLFE